MGLWNKTLGCSSWSSYCTGVRALISNFNGDPKYLDGDHFICSSPKVYKSVLKSVKPYFLPLNQYY